MRVPSNPIKGLGHRDMQAPLTGEAKKEASVNENQIKNDGYPMETEEVDEEA